ncbi:MAG: hypothetical protein MUO26_07655 [Methanotrichaceae archaeon]|nr:hypothetical protein [Methanotrichaceae archaeon]
MKINKSFTKAIVVCLLLVSVATVSTGLESYPIKVDVGPFMAEFNWNTSDPATEVIGSQKLEDYNIYAFKVGAGYGESHIDINIEDHGTPADVSNETLKSILKQYIAPNTKVTWNPVTIGGLPGIMGTMKFTTAPKDECYIAAYSPDGSGEQGSLIVTMAMLHTSEDLADMFLRSLKISRA